MSSNLDRMHYDPAFWPSYETFVVRHTLFSDVVDVIDLDDTPEGVAKQCSDLAHEHVEHNASGFAADWAYVTLAGVSWWRIARDLLDEANEARADRAQLHHWEG